MFAGCGPHLNGPDDSGERARQHDQNPDEPRRAQVLAALEDVRDAVQRARLTVVQHRPPHGLQKTFREGAKR